MGVDGRNGQYRDWPRYSDKITAHMTQWCKDYNGPDDRNGEMIIMVKMTEMVKGLQWPR